MTHPQPQPYYAPPAYAPAPPRDLTVYAVLAFATAAAATFIDMATATISGRAARHFDDTGAVDWSVPLWGAGLVLTTVAVLAGAIIGALWLHQARRNAELLEPTYHHTRSAGWAWGGWICPVVNLWFPFQVVRDVHRSISPRSNATVIGWWWAAFLVMSVALRFLGNATPSPEGAAGYQTGSVLVAAVMVVTLALWGLVLRTITREQHRRIWGWAA